MGAAFIGKCIAPNAWNRKDKRSKNQPSKFPTQEAGKRRAN